MTRITLTQFEDGVIVIGDLPTFDRPFYATLEKPTYSGGPEMALVRRNADGYYQGFAATTREETLEWAVKCAGRYNDGGYDF